MTNVIGDIAGNFKTLMALIDKMPEGDVIGVGDLIDRGPRSKDVLEWFMENGQAILGNHEHLMLDNYRKMGYYQEGLWQYNGGNATINSFGGAPPSEEILDWVESLPLYLETDDCLVAHSFVSHIYDLKESCELGDTVDDNPHSIIWNRQQPIRRPEYKMQIAGHNSQFGYRRFSDGEGEFAICIDSSGNGVLTGIHLTTMEIFQQEVID